MTKLREGVNSPITIWLLLALPWCYMIERYASGTLVYGEFIHISGDYSAQLLIITMALTPLRLMFPTQRWPVWLLQRRRYFGVAAFLYAVPHVAAYVLRFPLERVGGEALEPGMLTGWLALAIFLPLAVTSNDASLRALGRRWKTLHRLVYAAAALTFAHWLLTAFDPTLGTVHLAVLVVLESYRVWATHRRRD